MIRSIPILLFSSLAAAQAAEIRGTILDPSARPIEGARIECSGRKASTDSSGHFVLPGVENCEATLSKEGFATTKAQLAASGENRFTLALAALIEQVVVSATRAPVNVEAAGVSANVITSAELAQRQFPALLDVLRELPGQAVVQTSRNGGATSLFTRGADSTGTLVLLDGVPLNEPGGDLNFANLTTAGVDRVEVIRGPESTLFGAEASAGVIQLFTRSGDPEARRPHGSLTYERGSFQTDRWSANLNGGLAGRIDYSLTGDQFHTVGQYQNDFYRVTTGTANVGYRISSQTQLRAVFREYDSIVGVPNQVGYGIFDFGAHELDRDSTVSLRLDDTRGRNFYQRASFGYHRLRDRFDDNVGEGPYDVAAVVRMVTAPIPRVFMVGLVDPLHPPVNLPSGEQLVTQQVTLSPFPGLTVTDRRDFNYQGTLTHSGGALVFGYDYERQGGNITGADVARSNNGFFIHEQRAVTRRVFLSGGARLEQSSTFGTKFTPRGSASFLLFGEHGVLSSTFFHVSAARGITEPSLLENFARDAFFVGNPALRPEKTASYEAGITQEWFHRKLRTEVTAFRNSFRDLIVFVFLPENSTWQNIDSSWARGVEFTATARLTRLVSLSGNYTRMWTRITSSTTPDALDEGIGQPLARRPDHSGSVFVSIAPRRWTVLAGARITGERQEVFDLFGVTRNPGYQNVYLSGSYRLNRFLTPFVRIDNLLNDRYQEVLGYTALSRNAVGGVRLNW